MKRRFLSITVLCVAALLVSVAGTAGQGPVDTKEVTPKSIEALLASKISYQGVLQESGSPVTGNRNMQFLLFTNNTCAGAAAQTITKNNVPVQNGLFSVDLAVYQSLFNGQALWLRVRVGATDLGCSEIMPVPYALSLRPGAQVIDNNSSFVYHVENLGTGDAIRAFSKANATDYAAVYAVTDGTGTGVYGISSAGHGIYGISGANDRQAIYGEKVGSTVDGYAILGTKAGSSGVATRGLNTGTTGSGVSGISQNYIGTWGEVNSGSNYGFYSPDNLYSLNFHTRGATMQIVQNVGSTAVQAGDLVAFYGIAAPLEAGEPPVIQVATLTRANSTAVAGVAYSRYNIEAITKATDSGEKLGSAFEVTPDGPVAPGEYLLLIVQGPAQVRASALGGPIQPGDLLTSAATAGVAARAGQITVEGVTMAAPGTVFGKALEALPAGDGLIYVYVTLQ